MTDVSLTTSKILLVDDEPVNLKLLEKLLSSQGYSNLTSIQDPRLVLESCDKLEPDLILLDINMPHIDGFGVMELLRDPDKSKSKLTIPVIVLTAQNSRDVMLKALTVGARDFLSKPFDRTELLLRVETQLEVSRAQRIIKNENSILEELVAKRTEMLNKTRLDIVQRLGRAAEYKDNETGNHIIRMSQVSAIIANSLGWSKTNVDLMLNASPMHDIGKIGIPDQILRKPGKLDAEEWEIMKTHAQIGFELLSDGESELLDLASIIALHHHERWDGNGYPSGLKGEEIPQVARIVAVADVFDALTSKRPYKEPWLASDAISYLKEQSGKQFDPETIEHFMLCQKEIMHISKSYEDPDFD